MARATVRPKRKGVGKRKPGHAALYISVRVELYDKIRALQVDLQRQRPEEYVTLASVIADLLTSHPDWHKPRRSRKPAVPPPNASASETAWGGLK